MSIIDVKLKNIREYVGNLYKDFNARVDKIENDINQRLDHVENRVIVVDRDLNYFKNASNRHEAVIGEMRGDLCRLVDKVHHLEDYHCDCPIDKEEEDEEECEEDICPDCREQQIKEVFEQEQQKLKIYVKTLGVALKELSKHLEDLERS